MNFYFSWTVAPGGICIWEYETVVELIPRWILVRRLLLPFLGGIIFALYAHESIAGTMAVVAKLFWLIAVVFDVLETCDMGKVHIDPSPNAFIFPHSPVKVLFKTCLCMNYWQGTTISLNRFPKWMVVDCLWHFISVSSFVIENGVHSFYGMLCSCVWVSICCKSVVFREPGIDNSSFRFVVFFSSSSCCHPFVNMCN